MEMLYDRLRRYEASDYYGFHMPGHKRNRAFAGIADVCGIDITEIDGFDDLHHARGILKDAQERAAAVYGAQETHFLVNGSTAGVLSAVLGVTGRGDSVLVARNCHKSVYHAVYMNELVPVYLYPDFDEESQLNTEISVQSVRDALEENPRARAVIIVSPTYDGVVSDVAGIAKAAHERNVPLIVDEAHGAHFGFHPYFPENANRAGADIVVHSLHKTLPSLTQTALLHLNGTLVGRERVRRYLDMLQTSSPSYVLMAGMDSCIGLLDTEAKREALFAPYVGLLGETRKKLSKLRRLELLNPGEQDARFDRSKIILSGRNAGLDGRELSAILLKKYHLQMEMAAGDYVLAMTSVGDTREGMERLFRAAAEIDEDAGRMGAKAAKDMRAGAGRQTEADAHTGQRASGKTGMDGINGMNRLPVLPMRYTPAEAERLPAKEKGRARSLAWQDSVGRISLEYAYLYPPGVPLVVPGEQMTEEAARLLYWYERKGYQMEGLKKQGRIEVWADEEDILYHGEELLREGYDI